MIPETHDRITLRLKISAARVVFFNLQGMLPAVHFNYKLTINTDKIADIGTDRMLPSELTTGNRPIAQQPPQAAFGVGSSF
jgi:hypothetical protein